LLLESGQKKGLQFQLFESRFYPEVQVLPRCETCALTPPLITCIPFFRIWRVIAQNIYWVFGYWTRWLSLGFIQRIQTLLWVVWYFRCMSYHVRVISQHKFLLLLFRDTVCTKVGHQTKETSTSIKDQTQLVNP
jgi:hypothetical protein